VHNAAIQCSNHWQCSSLSTVRDKSLGRPWMFHRVVSRLSTKLHSGPHGYSDACLTQPWLQAQRQPESRDMAESAKLQLHCQKQACFCKHLQHTAVALLRHVHQHSLGVHTQQGAAQVNPFSTPPQPTPTAACVPSLAGCQHDTPSPTAQKTTHRGSTDYTLCCPANKAPARSQ
jgi:hypothetical protein